MSPRDHCTLAPWVVLAILVPAVAAHFPPATAAELPAAAEARPATWRSGTPSLPADAAVAWAVLAGEFPEAVARWRGERITAVYGAAMAAGRTPRSALENWMARHADIFGVARLEWSEARAADIGNGRTAFALRQELTVEGGILPRATSVPVEGGRLRLLSAREGQEFAITFAAARIVDTSTGVGPPRITAVDALLGAVADERTSHLRHWSEPQLVVLEDDLGDGPELFAAWRITGMESETAIDTTRIAYFHAETARLARIRSGVAGSEPVAGTIRGGTTAGLGPPLPGSTIEANLPMATVCLVGEQCTTTAFDGSYALATTSPSVEVEATLDSGYWHVVDQTGPDPVSIQSTAIPPELSADLMFNPLPPATQADSAAVNIFVNLHRSNGLFAAGTVNWNTILDTLPVLQGEANYPCTACGGGYFIAPARIALCRTLFPCANGAYSTIVSHEYGHYIAYHIVESLFSDAFVEGYADALALLVHDTHQFGLDYMQPGRPIRSPGISDVKFPTCVTSKYTRGALLTRIWWDIRLTMATGLPGARDLFVAWTLITSGPAAEQCAPPLEQSADQDTLIEVLIADDDDNMIENGTPNDEAICQAFADRDIDTQFAGSPC